MKDHKLKTALGAAFAAPEPARKREFLRKMPMAPVSHLAFMRSQAGYIRKSTWALWLVLLALALAAAQATPREAVWIVSSLTPFAALTAVTESARSALHGMEELEMSARFGLKSVVLARMGVLGMAHLALLGLLIPLTGHSAALGLVRTGTYLLLPYLLTTLLGLAIVRRLRGREGVYICGGAAILVSGLQDAVHRGLPWLYARDNFRWWLPVLALCAGLTAAEYRKTIRKTEELSWSL